MMRSKERIDTFTQALAQEWKENFQDLRFGQLMSNFFGWLMSEKGIDLFFPEEDDMLEYFKEYSEKYGKN